MTWIKRNLFFAIGGIISLALLIVAGVYDFKSYSHNSAALNQLNETYGTLKNLAGQKPSAGNAKVDNVSAAKEQEKQIRDWINQTGKYFQPIAAIPDSAEVTSEAFAAELRRAIDQLQHEAETADVALPPKYGFSFEAQRSLVKFAPDGLASLAAQLGEVKAISEVFFAARVNSLDSVQRVRVSDDDAAGPQADYLDDHSVTNDLAVVTPYAVTFRSFSGELAAVLAGFASSPHGFIVKGINVQSVSDGSTPNSLPGNGYSPSGPYGAPSGPSGPYGAPPGVYGGLPLPPPPAQPVPGKGGLQTVLKEQLLRVTLEIEIVKPLSKK